MNGSPYQLFPTDPEIVSRLVTLKQAAGDNRCSENTLRNNAKMQRLAAYQKCLGAPVYVLPDEVEKFLRARPDICSIFQDHAVPATDGNPSGVPAVRDTELPLTFLSGMSPTEVEALGSFLGALATQLTNHSKSANHPEP